jgi:UDP-N-acetylmuramyl pentapeptide synthase
MMLGGFDYNFEGRGGLIKKIKFILTLINKNLFYNPHLPIKSVMILEVGFDHQGEAYQWQDFFDNNLDIAVVTALTDEHNENYKQEFESTELDKLAGNIPDELIDNIKSNGALANTKNVILEMLKPIKWTKKYYIPTAINSLSNEIYIGETTTFAKYNPIYEVRADNKYIENILVSKDYLLPNTFAKSLGVAYQIAKESGIEIDVVREVFANLNLPKGRFTKLRGQSNSTIIDSTYNSDPDSVFGFLDSLEAILDKQNTSDYDLVKHNIVLGEMRELGEVATQKHQEVLNRLLSIKAKYINKIENVILLGTLWQDCDDTHVKKSDEYRAYVSYKDVIFNCYFKVGDIVKYYQQNLRPYSWFWIKGSQNTIFLEVLVESLLYDPIDTRLLCRQEDRWFEMRKPFL